MKPIPEIRNDRGIPTLYVDGEPFLVLAGEIHNSAAESAETMEREVWPYIEGLNLNTLIVPVYWDRLEAEAGRFDFTLPDEIITQARERGMRLIFLWFGLWKNAESSYAPGWVKRDAGTFFRAETAQGERLNAVSPHCASAVKKDARAFQTFMAHLCDIDGDQRTVIMVQVENETGLLGTPRDYCAAAEAAFAAAVPESLSASGTWREAFGEDAEEAFSAWYFASAVERIAKAGQEAYPLPMYTNAWLKQYPWYPGSYPAGGPVESMLDIWKVAAPSLFALAPDIYVPYAADIMEIYSRQDNPLVIPEIRKDAVTASYALAAFMGHHAVCYAPFGVEDLSKEEDTTPSAEIIKALSFDPLSFDLTGSREALKETYGLIDMLKPLYLRCRGTESLKWFLQRHEREQGAFLRLSAFDLTVEYMPRTAGCPAGAGVVFELDTHTFLIAGMMARFVFHPKPGNIRKIDFLRLERGRWMEGRWQADTALNGDERMTALFLEKPVCYLLELYEY